MSGSPVTRWASVALGAGVGIGSAYTECSYKFGESPAKSTPHNISEAPVSQVGSFQLLKMRVHFIKIRFSGRQLCCMQGMPFLGRETFECYSYYKCSNAGPLSSKDCGVKLRWVRYC